MNMTKSGGSSIDLRSAFQAGPGDLVGLIEDVDLALELAGRIGEPLAQAADVVDATVARGVDLDQVERRPLADRDARRAPVARVAVLEVRCS